MSTHSSCSRNFYSYVNQLKVQADRNLLSNKNLHFHIALLLSLETRTQVPIQPSTVQH